MAKDFQDEISSWRTILSGAVSALPRRWPNIAWVEGVSIAGGVPAQSQCAKAEHRGHAGAMWLSDQVREDLQKISECFTRIAVHDLSSETTRLIFVLATVLVTARWGKFWRVLRPYCSKYAVYMNIIENLIKLPLEFWASMDFSKVWIPWIGGLA